jgi:cyclopropane-fatty-acyl-phospholipid synthase
VSAAPGADAVAGAGVGAGAGAGAGAAPGAGTRSRLYPGRLMHARVGAAQHRFEYPVLLFAFDLDELDALDRRHRWFGHNRARPVALFDRDYLDGRATPLRECLLALVAARVPAAAVRRIVTLTTPRVLGHAFNPVTFHYLEDEGGAPLAVVAEVNNTFGERHLYVLDDLVREGEAWVPRTDEPKAFYVSPFYDVSGAYAFHFSHLGDKLDLRIRLEREGKAAFVARLTAEARPFTGRALAGALARNPLVTLLTLPRIWVQAARLYAGKRVAPHAKPAPAGPRTRTTAGPGPIAGIARRVALGTFERITEGRLVVRLPEGKERVFGAGAAASSSAPGAAAPEARLEVRRHRFFPRLARGADIALGESYMDGDCDSPDLPALLTVLLRNRERLEGAGGPLAALVRAPRRPPQAHTTNTPRRSRSNIEAHYDLGNEFFRLFLDDTLTYSSAMFAAADELLESAQERKIDRALARTGLASAPATPGASAGVGVGVAAAPHLLEIGSGWGSLALRAAQRGWRVTSLTLSREQQALARERARAAGVADRVAFELTDYREARGAYDAIVSIEMLEAVGHRYYGAFFAALDRLLKPGGRAVVQSILIADARYAGYLERPDWIQKHIFPGGLVPSLSALTAAARAASRLALEQVEAFGLDYARTLERWRQRLQSRRAEALALGYSEAFLRKWEYYLAYCETGFREREITVAQLVWSRPGEVSALPAPAASA